MSHDEGDKGERWNKVEAVSRVFISQNDFLA